MSYYSKQYAVLSNQETWDFDIDDMFANLYKNKAVARTREKKIGCDGLEATRIKVTPSFERFIMIYGKWEKYPDILKTITS